MAKTLEDLALTDILPSSIGSDSTVKNAALALDPELQNTALQAVQLPILSRIDALPEAWIDRLAWQWHVDSYEPLNLTLAQKREIVKRALIVHRYKGTPYAVRQALQGLGFESKVIENTGTPYIFDLSVKLDAGADVSDVSQKAIKYVNSAKPASRHLRTIAHHVETGGVIAIANVSYSGARVEVWPMQASTASTSGPIRFSAAVTGYVQAEVWPRAVD